MPNARIVLPLRTEERERALFGEIVFKIGWRLFLKRQKLEVSFLAQLKFLLPYDWKRMVPAPTLLLLIFSLAAPRETPAIGYLYQPAFDVSGELRGPSRPYRPQPGDIFLSTDKLRIAVIGHQLAGGQGVHHSGLIVLRPDGSPATLEAGPHHVRWVRVLDIDENLGGYLDEGNSVWIRQRKTPLSAEQSRLVTDFAMNQDGKHFAWERIMMQVTPFRARSHLRNTSMGGPHGERRRYFCSELALETLLAAGLLDPARTRPSATYPGDLFFGASENSFINQNLDINSSWEPPARWTLSPP